MKMVHLDRGIEFLERGVWRIQAGRLNIDAGARAHVRNLNGLRL